MIDSDILFNADTFDWKLIHADLKSILIHELGHVLGLQHLPISSQSVMNQYPYQSGFIRNKLSDYEISAINKVYFSSTETPALFIEAYLNGDRSKSLALIRKNANRSEDSFYAEGFIELLENNYAASTIAFKKCIELNPGNSQAHYYLADAYSMQNKTLEAKIEYEKLLKQFPNYYEALADLGLIYMQNGEKQKAIGLLKRALKVNPVHYPACALLLKLTGVAN